jgi:outer membrane biosynthesis protein TonB
VKICLLGVALLNCLVVSGCATNATLKTTPVRGGVTSTLRVIDHASFEKPPVSLHRVPPELTDWDRRTLSKFPSVAVEIRAVIDVDGIPNEIEVLSSEDEYIGGAVARAIESWRFEPAIKEGKPARCQVVLKMVLKDEDPDALIRAPHILRQSF